MRRLSLQWRLTLAMAALVAAACLLLALLSCRSAGVQIVDLADYVVNADEFGENLEIEICPEVQEALTIRVQSTLRTLELQVFLGMIVITLLAAGCTYMLAGRVLSPLRNLSMRMDAIQARNLSELLPQPAAQDEIAQLTRSFNGMLNRLNSAFDVQRRFAANAAHELRTPLAVLQTELDVLQKQPQLTMSELRDGIRSAQTQTGRLSHLIGELLEMTRLESIERNDVVHLSEMIEEVLCDLAGVAEEYQVTLRQEGSDAAVIANDPLLYRACCNLIENGIKYNRPGGNVTVSIESTGDEARVIVADTGIGISQEYLEQVFAPFFRVDKSRSRKFGGAGLGLALTKAIVEQHNGSIRLESTPGNGTRAILTLPSSADAKKTPFTS